MLKKISVLFIVLICLDTIAVAADINFNDSGADHLWTNSANWIGGAIPNNSATGAAFNFNATTVEITSDTNASCKGFMLGMYGVTNSAEITGGTMNCSWLDVGRANQNGGNGTLQILAGNITVTGNLKVPTQFSTMINPANMGSGHIDLLGGVITCGVFSMGNQQIGDGGGIGTMYVTHGKLLVNGNQKAVLQGYIDSGYITTYPSFGMFNLDYNIMNVGYTTLTATHSGQAQTPVPDDGGVNISPHIQLSWLPGTTIDSFDVHFGTATIPPFVGNQNEANTTYNPGQLQYDTTYYWQISEISEGEKIEGAIWSFTTGAPPAPATDPNPADGALNINAFTEVQWIVDARAQTFDIYFGATNPPPFIGNFDEATYYHGSLTPNTTYYWQVDQINSSGMASGPLWHFTVAPLSKGDVNGDWFINYLDIEALAMQWLNVDCMLPSWCSNADMNNDATVDLGDYTKLANKIASAKPNVIIFYTDDQGWAESSVAMIKDMPESRSAFFQTPALDAMAQAGMIFSNAYAAAPTCTPSRVGLQFGKTPARLQYSVVHDRLAFDRGIDLKDQLSIPQMVAAADADYVTAHFGKWGYSSRGPDHAEYHQSDGNTNNGEGDYLNVQNQTPLPADDPKRINSITARADLFMEEQVAAGKPFFMQLSHYAVHVDHQALEATVDKYRHLGQSAAPKYQDEATYLYAAMIENLDSALGHLRAKVEALGITDNTYIIFTSDNGGGFRGNGPLKGGKAFVWEGGIRVPMVVCGPSVMKNTYCDVPVAAWDFFPTINEMLHGDPLPPAHDGGSLVDLFVKGNNGVVVRGTNELIFHFPWYASAPPVSAMIDGDYKIMMSLNNGEYRLFNLKEDIGEENDLKNTMPVLAQQMYERLNQYLTDVDAEDVEDMRQARENEVQGYIDTELAKPNPDPLRLQTLYDALDEFEQNRHLDMDGNIF